MEVPADSEKPVLQGPEQFGLIIPAMEKFNGNGPAMYAHLCHVHTEACGCQISPEHEAENKVWHQKKVQFMELHKQSGLEFDDFLNR